MKKKLDLEQIIRSNVKQITVPIEIRDNDEGDMTGQCYYIPNQLSVTKLQNDLLLMIDFASNRDVSAPDASTVIINEVFVSNSTARMDIKDEDTLTLIRSLLKFKTRETA